MDYSWRKKIAEGSFQTVIMKTKEVLKENDFGILTEIDVKQTLKEKLGVEYGQYVILGVCNPSLAYRGLQVEKEIGLFLPCNVIVYEEKEEIFVSVIIPTVAMAMLNNVALEKIATEAGVKLKKALDSLN